MAPSHTGTTFFPFSVQSALPQPRQCRWKTTLCAAGHRLSWKILRGKSGMWYSGSTVQGSLGTTQPSEVKIRRLGPSPALEGDWADQTQLRRALGAALGHVPGRNPRRGGFLSELPGCVGWRRTTSQGVSNMTPRMCLCFPLPITVSFLCILKHLLKRQWLLGSTSGFLSLGTTDSRGWMTLCGETSCAWWGFEQPPGSPLIKEYQPFPTSCDY